MTAPPDTFELDYAWRIIALFNDELEARTQERDHYAEQLGLVYWHVTGGLLSKAYDFKAVESQIDDHLNEFYGKEAREAEAALTAMTQERDAARRALDENLEHYADKAEELTAARARIEALEAALLRPLMTSEAKRLRADIAAAISATPQESSEALCKCGHTRNAHGDHALGVRCYFGRCMCLNYEPATGHDAPDDEDETPARARPGGGGGAALDGA